MLGLCLAAGAAGAGPSYRLVAPSGFADRPDTFAPLAGGHVDGAFAATDETGATRYDFSAAVCGSTVSETGKRPAVGDYLVPPTDLTIDWAAFSKSLETQTAVTNGSVFYVRSATNVAERLVIARSGTFTIDWKLAGGESKTVTYEATVPATVATYRLIWTSAPFNGSTVTIPSNYGVELHGDPTLFYDASRTNAYGSAILDYGVHYQVEANTIAAYATQRADGSVYGPKGVFVVAYYDSGRKERYLGHTVVSVEEPSPVELQTTVGAEVRPQNENYDPTSGTYSPEDVSSDSATSGSDSRAPYFFVQKRQSGQYHAKENRVFAIATTADGQAGAKRAAINWLVSDAFDVKWMLEQSYYHITWPDSPTVVLAESGTAPGVTVPDSYTASLLAWQEPAGAVRIADNAPVISQPSRFTLRLDNARQDDFWLVPLRAAYGNDETAFPRQPLVYVPVGSEVRPDVSADSLVKTNLAAFICEARAPGRNWNPNFYHNGSTVSDDETFAAYESSVWFVNVTDQPFDAELWWFGQYAVAGMDEPLTLPMLPQYVKAVWPEEDAVAEVVFASGRGSAAGGRATAGRAICFESAEAQGSIRFPYVADTNGILTIGFAFHPAAAESPSAGEIFALAQDESRLSFAVTTPQSGTTPAVCRLACGNVALDVTCRTNQWTRFLAVVATNGVSLYANERLSAAAAGDLTDFFQSGYLTLNAGRTQQTAASGVAFDDVSVWNEAFDAEAIAASATNALAFADASQILDLTFDAVLRTDEGVVVAQDVVTFHTFTGTGFAVREPGAPQWTSGLFAASDGIAPRAYVQNDATKIGYKPNLEHALALAQDDSYALYALRTDFNDATRPPYALVEYAANGRGAMRLYRVAMTNAWYVWPSQTCTVGKQIPIFSPYDKLPSGLSPDTTFPSLVEHADGTLAYRDRTGSWWARCAGNCEEKMYYYGEPGFVAGDGSDLSGVSIPAANLMNCFCSLSQGIASKPVRERDALWLSRQFATGIELCSTWPKNVSMMSVGQVLSKSEDGLPDVYDMKTCAVVYPFYGYQPDVPTRTDEQTHEKLQSRYPMFFSSNRVAKLIDPTCRKTQTLKVTASFPDEYGFTLGAAGNLYSENGLYYFRNLPANVSTRLFVDISAGGSGEAHLCLIGDYVENDAGLSYLRANSLSKAERDGIKSVFEQILATKTDASVQSKLQSLIQAVDALYDQGDIQPTRQSVPRNLQDISWLVLSNDYHQAADHYALVAETDVSAGGDYVVLVENDGADAGSQAVSFHVLFVTNALYCGKLATVTDSSNALSEQANVLYTAPLGKTADQYLFEWMAVEAPSDGHVPAVPSVPTDHPMSADAAWGQASCECREVGSTCVDAVRDGATQRISKKALANRYWTLHYRATNETCAVRGWSNWCAPTLVEGWVQRVLNSVTPFAQRLSDLSQNTAELGLTMLEQIGAPWEGDVALNNENLTQVGLEQLYRTILNRAESMSIAQGEGTTSASTSAGVNKQLVECVARLADLYMTLGGEAYSDAQNPLVGSADGTAFAGDVFCFANQVPTLLDEELALLRGRSSAVAPALTESPFYNRLIWNFTKGVTQGEVAYVNNYGIKAVDGVLDAAAAAKLYPQGHGDAYGHYLSAIKGYYRLLRNPVFVWGEPSMMEMLVAEHVVNMDYEEEDKFAECAYNLAKIGGEAVKLTALKQFRDAAGETMTGYFDNPATARTGTDSSTQESVTLPQAFGYGEWACRAGYGALCNWAVANALLPADAASAVSYFDDQSIATVTRETAASLTPLGASVAAVENTVNTVDAGGNVLGFDADHIPFREISAAALEGLESGVGAVTPYEQLREIAGEALESAGAVQTEANVYGSRLASIVDEEADLEAEAAEREASYEQELIAIFGRPFADDIGPGKTYAQGYTGPDLYHYMYVNLSDYGLTNTPALTGSICYLNITNLSSATGLSAASLTITEQDHLKYGITADGMVAMPSTWTGMRAAEGSVQTAYRNCLAAFIALKTAQEDYQAATKSFAWSAQEATTVFNQVKTHTESVRKNLNSIENSQIAVLALNLTNLALDYVQSVILGSNDPEPNVSASTVKKSYYVFNSEADKDHYLSTLVVNQVSPKVGTILMMIKNDKLKNELAHSLASVLTSLNQAQPCDDSMALASSQVATIVRGNNLFGFLNENHSTDDLTTAFNSFESSVAEVQTTQETIQNNYTIIQDSTVKLPFTDTTVKIPHMSMEKITFEGWTHGLSTDPLAGYAQTIEINSTLKRFFFGTTYAWYIDTMTLQLGMNVTAAGLEYRQEIKSIEQSQLDLDEENFSTPLAAYQKYRTAALEQNAAALTFQTTLAEYLARVQEYRTILAEGEAILAERTRWRTRLTNVATQRRYADMYARVAQNAALSRYRTAFDTAQKRVFELARLYDYETGLGAVGTPSGTGTFADAALASRALGVSGMSGDGSVTDGGLWELVTRMDANYAQVKTQLGFNNPDTSEKSFSLRFSNFRIAPGAKGDRVWRQKLATYWRDDVFADAAVATHCQRPADATGAVPGFVIPFESSIYLAKNFFGQSLLAGDSAYSSSAQGVKILKTGLTLAGYADLVAPNGLADEPAVYLVPVGDDYQRLSDGAELVTRRFPVAAERLSTLRADGTACSRQLVARSVWNDKWLIVIPASSLHSDPTKARAIFLDGINGQPGVSDVKVEIRAFAR